MFLASGCLSLARRRIWRVTERGDGAILGGQQRSGLQPLRTALHTKRISLQNNFCESQTWRLEGWKVLSKLKAYWALPTYPIFEDEKSNGLDKKLVKQKIVLNRTNIIATNCFWEQLIFKFQKCLLGNLKKSFLPNSALMRIIDDEITPHNSSWKAASTKKEKDKTWTRKRRNETLINRERERERERERARERERRRARNNFYDGILLDILFSSLFKSYSKTEKGKF